MTKPVALIIGITGQDGSYLAKLLIDKGFKVFGTTRDKFTAHTLNLKKIGILNEVVLLTTDITDFRSILFALEKTRPDYVFHLAGQTSVGLSFELPFESVESIFTSTLNILEAIRFFNKNIKIFIPCSSDCFGPSTKNDPSNETTKHNPMSPYAVAKSSSYWLAMTYKNSYNMFICVGFLSNHESPLRGRHFVTSKLFRDINRIKNKEIDSIKFGDLSIIRDWGWAPSYVNAIYKMITDEKPNNYIIATGKSYSLQQIVDKSFEFSGLGSSSKYIKVSDIQKRPNEISAIYLDPKKAKIMLKWEIDIDLDTMIMKLLKGQLY
tara:strand:+ start:4546 stop:5511 length:966 start_codon:yes stop_codon:yes gene_type:complete